MSYNIINRHTTNIFIYKRRNIINFKIAKKSEKKYYVAFEHPVIDKTLDSFALILKSRNLKRKKCATGGYNIIKMKFRSYPPLKIERERVV